MRVSLISGRVLQRWWVPALGRALLAVDDDGLWIAPSIYSGAPEHLTGSRRARFQTLYRIAPGDASPHPVMRLGPSGARWLATYGHTIWLDSTSGAHGQLWRLTGARRTTAAPLTPAPSQSVPGEGPGPLAAGPGGTVYEVIPGAYPEQAQRIVQTSGTLRQSVLTSLRPPGYTNIEQPLTLVSHGALYVVDPPTLSFPGGHASPTIQGTGTICRVTPDNADNRAPRRPQGTPGT